MLIVCLFACLLYYAYCVCIVCLMHVLYIVCLLYVYIYMYMYIIMNLHDYHPCLLVEQSSRQFAACL